MPAEGITSGGALGRWLFATAGLLVLEFPSSIAPLPDNTALAWAFVFAVAFALLGALAVLVELYRPASDAYLRLRFAWSTPVVVVGLGWVGKPIAEGVRGMGRPVLAVVADDRTPDVGLLRAASTRVIAGDMTDAKVRQRAALTRAFEIFIATGNDTRNLEIVGELLQDATSGRLGQRKSPLSCYLHLSSPDALGVGGTTRLLHDDSGTIRFQVFNLHEQDAREALLREGDGILRERDGSALVHCFLFGFGLAGQTMALQIARLAHLKDCRRPRMTIVGEKTDIDQFTERHPAFAPDSFDLLTHRRIVDSEKDGWTSRHWRPVAAVRAAHAAAVEYAVNAEYLITSSADGPRSVREQLLDRLRLLPDAPETQEPPTWPVLIVCFDDERLNFETALWLRELLDTEQAETQRLQRVRLYVRTPSERGFRALLRRSPDFHHSATVDVHTYGRWDASDAYERARASDQLAMARVALSRYNPDDQFDRLPPMFQASNMDVAAHAVIKLDAIGARAVKRSALPPSPEQTPVSALTLSTDEIEMVAQMEHNRWMAERLITGWRHGEKRTIGSVGNEHENRRRLSLVPWRELSAAQQAERRKDVAQVEALPEMFAAADYVINARRG